MTKDVSATPLLDALTAIDDLRNLPESDLPKLAQECRDELMASLNQCGGHFGSSLGAVELTIALHYLFDTPNDKLIWDVGHQAYIHKILTGRREQLTTIRRAEGLAPFPCREESKFDAFGVGHSSTSISAALGMAEANARTEDKKHMVAVIGDGAITAGLPFEAMNHAGDIKTNMLVVLNDNNMSISGNVGALKNYVARILSGKIYTTVREGSKRVLSNMPTVWELARRTEGHIRGMVVPGTLFEELGFSYFGPIDGHDLPALLKTLKNIKNIEGPKFLHVVTQKGKGYEPAEADPIKYHAVAPGFLSASKAPSAPKPPTYSQIFGDWLCDMAKQSDKCLGITPAMREGSGLVRFAKEFPERYFDVGIAEQHSVTFAAGLACEGFHPVVAIYSSFLQRAYDQLIHDVALQNLPVLFALDRAGIVGGDGATHNGAFDLSYLQCVPNMIIMAPADENECRQMLYTGYQHQGPCAVRYPRGVGPGVAPNKAMAALPIGKAELVREGETIALLAFGTTLAAAKEAGEQLDATVVNMRFVKPLDEDMLERLAQTHQLLITIEDNAIRGGAGSSVAQHILASGKHISVINLGLPDHFIEHGEQSQLYQKYGLDPEGIVAAAAKIFPNVSHRACKVAEKSVNSA